MTRVPVVAALAALAAGAAAAQTNLPPATPPNAPAGLTLFVQGFELQAGGPLLGVADASDGLAIRIGNAVTGCP